MTARDPWGRLLADPDTVSPVERVEILRRAANDLVVADSPEVKWLGRCLQRWLREGGNLERILALKPPRGSRQTPARLVRQSERDAALLSFACEVGSDSKAALILKGIVPCPSEARPRLEELIRLNPPKTAGSISNARRRASLR